MEIKNNFGFFTLVGAAMITLTWAIGGYEPYERVIDSEYDYIVKVSDTKEYISDNEPRFVASDEMAGCNCWIFDIKGTDSIRTAPIITYKRVKELTKN